MPEEGRPATDVTSDTDPPGNRRPFLFKSSRLKGPVSAPEVFVVLVLAMFGGFLALAIPFGAGWDEETHLVRTWDLAHWVLLPNGVARNQLPYPILYQDLSYRRQLLLQPIEVEAWLGKLALPLDEEGYRYSELETRSVYPPLLLLPHALGLRYFGLAQRLPALPAFYASRLSGLVAYTFLAWLAVRIVPFGKWTLALLALTPTAVFLAATIGADPLSNGFGLIFIAGCLSVAHQRQIGWRGLGALLALSLFLFMAKPNMVALALLPLLILSPRQFKMRGGLAVLGMGLVVLAVLLAGGWWFLAYRNDLGFVGSPGPSTTPGHALSALLTFARGAPLDLLDNGRGYLEQWIARYGYDYWDVPPITYVLYLGGILVAVLVDGRGNSPSRRTRIGLAMTFMAAVLLTQLLLYIKDSTLGGLEISGVQGRYFIPFIPLLLLAVIGLPRRPDASAVGVGLPAVQAVAALSIYTASLVLSYYLTCGSALLQPGLCYLPAFKNWDPNARYTAPLSKGQLYSQEVVAECDGLEEISVWLDRGTAVGENLTEVTIRDTANDRILMSQLVTHGELPQGGWLTASFAQEGHSARRQYLLSLQGQGLAADNGPRLALTLKPEYTAGQLYANGSPMDVDLVFQYGCLVGIKKAISVAPE